MCVQKSKSKALVNLFTFVVQVGVYRVPSTANDREYDNYSTGED